MSEQKKSTDARSHSSDDEKQSPGKSSSSKGTTSSTSRRSGRRREDEPANAASGGAATTASRPATASSVSAPSTTAVSSSTATRRIRLRRSEEDDATVSSKQSHSTKSSVTKDENNNDGATPTTATLKESKSYDSGDSTDGGKPRSSGGTTSTSRRSRKEPSSSSSKRTTTPSSSTTTTTPRATTTSKSSSSTATASSSSAAAFDGDTSAAFDNTAAFGGSDGFGGFADAAFGDNIPNGSGTPTFTSTTAPTFNSAFSTNVDFEAAFEDMDFGGTSSFNPGFDALDPINEFPSQPEKVWDKSPFTDVPKAEDIQIALQQKTIMNKRFHGNPVNNPANGNIIFATTTNNGVYLHEVDPSRSYMQVASVPILTSQLQAKIATKYNATVTAVGTVWNLAVGCNGPSKEQVAVIVDFKILEATTSMRVVVVWQLVCGTFHLEHVTTPPSGGDFACDVSNFQIADGLLFVAGSSPKGACIFISKPAVREAWSANFLTGSGSVSVMSLTRGQPYLVVALADSSVTVWTYRSALASSTTASNSNNAKTSKRWLFPLCRLDCLTAFSTAKPVFPGLNEEEPAPSNASTDVGYCTHLAWLPVVPSHKSLPLLAAAFENGFAIFHVSLPVAKDTSVKSGYRALPEPTQSTVVSSTPMLSPIAVQRWHGKHTYSFVSWLQYGPLVDPCIAVLLHDAVNPVAKVLVCSISIPLYTSRVLTAKRENLPCHVIASMTIAKESNLFPTGLLHGYMSVVGYSTERLSSLTLATAPNSSRDVFSLLRQPVMSGIPGLSSSGDPYLTDTVTDKDGILYVFSTIFCDRTGTDDDASILRWALPQRRIWLCRAVAGDTRETCVEEKKEERGFGDRDEVMGGASSDVVCELSHESLVGVSAFRIVRCKGRNVCAVLFRASLGSGATLSGTFSSCADSIILVDFSSSTFMEVMTGRDITFMPCEESERARGLVLSPDGSSLTLFRWTSSGSLEHISSFRPLVGVDSMEDYVDSRRVAMFSEGSHLNLMVIGERLRDRRVCVAAGEICDMEQASESEWWKLLPNVATGRSALLEQGEDVVSFIGLQADETGYRNFALSTSTRVVILSSALSVAAECRNHRASSCLSPLGSFAVAFSDESSVRYLCCLEQSLSQGAIMSLSRLPGGSDHSCLMAIRPDRVLLSPCQGGISLVEVDQNPNSYRLPAPSSRPAVLLEPMLANAVCIGGKQNPSNPLLRVIVEKFGRKVTSLTHSENEGIGPFGAGLTPGALAILSTCDFRHAASWLLTGTANFERSANTRILPPWLPVAPKAACALNTDAMLHVVSHGDVYFNEYIKSPDHNAASILPRQSDAVSGICREYAQSAILRGEPIDALKALDIAGTGTSENLALQLSLLLEKKKGSRATAILKSLSGFEENGKSRPSGSVKSATSLAALAQSISANAEGATRRSGANELLINGWMKPLAPSLLRSKTTSRTRNRILQVNDLKSISEPDSKDEDPLWSYPCNESKHVWNEGPRKEKGNLLVLDSIEDWLGRRRLVIFGNDGASTGKDRGEKTLADILNQDDDSFGGAEKDSVVEADRSSTWVDGVGEGRSDEANLSGYFRLSEGEDEDSLWRTEGLQDLSSYQNKAMIVGDSQHVILEQSTSSVDEGESGKVKSLFDLVFSRSGLNVVSGLALPAGRGSSLDIGVLHGPEHGARKKASIEFWYYLPAMDDIKHDIVLARRTMGVVADDMEKVALASERDSVLWELLVKPSGELEFRTCGGSTLSSLQNEVETSDPKDEETPKPYLAVFDRWNHVCVVLSSRETETSDCSVTILMKGVEVATKMTSMLPPTVPRGDPNKDSRIAEAMGKSHMLFGLNHNLGFRLTELRIWACERSSEDTQSFLYEYLTAAEQKKKFKVKIANKNKKGAVLGKGLGIAPPKSLLSAKSGETDRVLALSSNPVGVSLAPKPMEGLKLTDVPPNPKHSASIAARPSGQVQPTSPSAEAATPGVANLSTRIPTDDERRPLGATVEELDGAQQYLASASEEVPDDADNNEVDHVGDDVAATLWDTAVPLSHQLRPSAAAALIRGPPATRHYGGNRGGLPDFSGVERFGVGGIAVCGSEKTIVFRDNEDPPALTYPIGASGAVISDQMDDEGSEFLCCFLAKEGRMVVFELRSRTVVVELQMTTKLNFWRYLPPEAAGNTLCFMLVTPVGGFHWKPLEESPRPHQVWKRGSDLQGKKVVNYEEGGSNGLDGADISSTVGLVTVTRSTGGVSLECWLLPIAGDSNAQLISEGLLGACLCQPLFVEDGPFLPLLVTVSVAEGGVLVSVLNIAEPKVGSLTIGDVYATQIIEVADIGDYGPPALAMGPLPDAICVSLANIIVVILRRKGLVAAFELEENEINTIAMESVDHYVIDAVMRYSSDFGGAEIVMLLSDDRNPKDGRIVSFCFRSAA